MFSVVKNIQKNAKLQNWSNYNELLLFDVKTIKKQLKTTYAIKLRTICIHLTSKQSKTLRYGRKTFKTTQNYQTDQITMDCIDLTSKQSKMLRYVAKLRKWSNYSALHRFDVKTIKNLQWRRKIFKTTLNYKTDQITMNCFYLMSKWSKQLKTTNSIKLRSICIDLTSKQSKMLRYVAKHSKQLKTTKVIKL